MLKFLIVDDSLLSRSEMKKAIKDINHTVLHEAKDAIEAMEIYKEHNVAIDFTTMDIDMPDVNGIVAVKRIMAINKDAKIIMVTSRGQEDMVKESIKAGAIGYILKPITKNRLKKVIDSIFKNVK